MKNKFCRTFIKRLLTSIFCSLAMLELLIPAYADDTINSSKDQIRLYINGYEPSDCRLLIINGVAYIPLRTFCSYFGSGNYEWNDESVSVSSDNYTLKVEIGYPYIIANERFIYYGNNVINYLFDGITYVPLRSIGKLFELEIIWDGSSNSIFVNGHGNIIESGESFYNADDIYWLSRIISAESKGEPLEGKIAVGNVVLNRVKSSEFPNDIESVIFDTQNGVQFSPVVNLSLYDEPTNESIIAAKICLEGYSLSNSILYFLNEAVSTQKWIQNNCTYEFKIENHSFYS